MTEQNNEMTPVRYSRKEIRKIIEKKLDSSLSDFRTLLGDKKFDGRIRKTAKRLGNDFSKDLPKKKDKKQKVKIEKAP